LQINKELILFFTGTKSHRNKPYIKFSALLNIKFVHSTLDILVMYVNPKVMCMFYPGISPVLRRVCMVSTGSV